MTDLAGSLVTSSSPPGRLQKRPDDEHGTPVSRYEQLMAAGGPQMLATSNVMYSGTVLPATRQMLATSNVCGVDCGCSSPSCTVVRCYLPPGRCWRRAMSEAWTVDAAVRHVLWCGVTCHPADAADEQCLRCGCSSPSCTV